MTVQDQIRLWELEKNRMKSQEGAYKSGPSQGRLYAWVLMYPTTMTRLPLYRLRLTGGLRIRTELREAVRSRALGELSSAVFLRYPGGPSEHPRVYRTEDSRQCLMWALVTWFSRFPFGCAKIKVGKAKSRAGLSFRRSGSDF